MLSILLGLLSLCAITKTSMVHFYPRVKLSYKKSFTFLKMF